MIRSRLGKHWLSKTLFECGLIVLSISLALSLNGWKQTRDHEESVTRSINNFENEIKRNRLRIEDVKDYRNGVQEVLKNHNSAGKERSDTEFRQIMDALQPIVLTNSAWETAMATGVLARMDFELVSALTLTYNTQNRFNEEYRMTVRTLLEPSNLNDQNLELTIHNASQFVTNVIAQEAELIAYYDQMLKMLNLHISKET